MTATTKASSKNPASSNASSSKTAEAERIQNGGSAAPLITTNGTNQNGTHHNNTTENHSPPPKQNQQQQQQDDAMSNLQARGKSMKDRSKIPYSFVVTMVSIVGLQICSGVWSKKTITSAWASYQAALTQLQQLLQYSQALSASFFSTTTSTTEGEEQFSTRDYVVAAVVTLAVAWVTYILFLAPLLWGGFWTGPRSNRHMIHRYMGLLYLIQYPLAWIEFAQNYEASFQSSFLPHLIALNGMTQAWSAFFSFKVLPELNDAGYYSDKSVLSRTFVHENAFFQMMTVFGSLYYIDECRQTLRSTTMGRCLEYVYIFWPYVLIRPFFPVTRFKDAGSTHKGRTATNQTFYEIGTYLVKIFFLYAKYFLGFYFNFLIFLELPDRVSDWKLLRGCLLLNIGTVSIAVFLHTLRFKKIFPGVLTFSIYLGQIYATILGIPFAYHLFAPHGKLLLVCFFGLLCNMTRSRKMHALWCFGTMCLLSYPGIEW